MLYAVAFFGLLPAMDDTKVVIAFSPASYQMEENHDAAWGRDNRYQHGGNGGFCRAVDLFSMAYLYCILLDTRIAATVTS
jgi:hypothetical protein